MQRALTRRAAQCPPPPVPPLTLACLSPTEQLTRPGAPWPGAEDRFARGSRGLKESVRSRRSLLGSPLPCPRWNPLQRRKDLILATTKVEDFDRFLEIFSTKGAEKRKQHGSKGATVFRDPNEEDRVWVLFDWDGAGRAGRASSPTPRSRRSCKKPGTKVSPRRRSSEASTTPSRARRGSGPNE